VRLAAAQAVDAATAFQAAEDVGDLPEVGLLAQAVAEAAGDLVQHSVRTERLLSAELEAVGGRGLRSTGLGDVPPRRHASTGVGLTDPSVLRS